ncbi:MAG TPA: hypothetical protein DCQ96_07035 [Verrucomicrobiales bacterium]|nr:hypothetical protein [Verrucomicrobiales bacterium]
MAFPFQECPLLLGASIQGERNCFNRKGQLLVIQLCLTSLRQTVLRPALKNRSPELFLDLALRVEGSAPIRLLSLTISLPILVRANLSLPPRHIERFEGRENPVVVFLAERLKLMIVAPRALQGLPEERH